MASRFTEEDVNKYKKFKKVDGATYRKVNAFLRKRTFITAREWALARLCTDFRTRNGAEMTFIGKNLPRLVPFMEEEYTPQAVNQARNSFKKKVRISGATFFYGAMCGFFTQEELDDLLFEASEVARFLLEVERTSLDIDEEIEVEDRITEIMRSVGKAAARILQERQNGTFTDLDGDSSEEDGPGGKTAGPDMQAGVGEEEEGRDESAGRAAEVSPGPSPEIREKNLTGDRQISPDSNEDGEDNSFDRDTESLKSEVLEMPGSPHSDQTEAISRWQGERPDFFTLEEERRIRTHGTEPRDHGTGDEEATGPEDRTSGGQITEREEESPDRERI